MKKVSEVSTVYGVNISSWECDSSFCYTEHLKLVESILNDERYKVVEFRAKIESGFGLHSPIECNTKEKALEYWGCYIENNITCFDIIGFICNSLIRVNVSMPLYGEGEITILSNNVNTDSWINKHGQTGESNEDFTNRRCDVHEKNIEEHLVS